MHFHVAKKRITTTFLHKILKCNKVIMAEQTYSKCNNSYADLSSQSVTALCIFLLMLLLGCIPKAKQPLAPVDLPANFSMQGTVPFHARWWLDFQDASLALMISQALTDNFSLRLAKERIVEAQAVARQAGAFLLPAVDGQGAVSSIKNYPDDTSSNFFLLALAASYEIDLWGRLRNQRDAASLDAQATEADYQTAAISLAAELAIIWYQLVESDLQLDLLNQQKETNTKVLALISAQFRAGQVGIADVLQQRQLVESNIGALATLRADLQVLKHQLAILTGVQPGTIHLPQRMQLPNLPPLPATGIPLDILSERPDIQSSFLRLRAADNRVAAAVASQLPKLAISADLSTSSDRSRDLFNNWFSSLGANLFGPIFDGGLRQADVARNESIARQRFYGHGQIILEAIGEVENSLVREKEQQINLRSLETQLQYATETIVHVANRYRQGAEDYQRVLLALLSQQNLQRNILAGRRQLINYRISLYRALSGRIPLLETKNSTEDNPANAAPTNNSTPAGDSNS
jgi:NodT family efflux transporter outer membrane factor (OMF) lipoprotein